MGGMYRWERLFMSSSSSWSELPSSSEESPPSSWYSGPPWCERTVPTPSVCDVKVSVRPEEDENELTGGAETRLGLERLTSSEKISSNSRRFSVLGGITKPSLIWIVPVEGVLARVDRTGRLNGCNALNTL